MSIRFVAIGLLLALAGESAPAQEADRASLLGMLENESGAVRMTACVRLGRRADRRDVPHLIPALRDPAVGVRVAAVDALSAIGDEIAVPHLARSLEDDHPTVRGRALLALGKLAGRYVTPRVAAHLLDPDAGVRVCAVRALGELGDPLRANAIRELLDRTTDDVDHVLLATAIVALTRLEEKKALDDLFRRVGDADAFGSWLIRSSLAWAVGECGERGRLPFLRRCFAAEDDRVSGAAATALLRLGEEEAVLATLEDVGEARRRVAVAALAGTGDPRFRDRLLERTRDASLRVRLEAAIGLSRMGAPEAFPYLLEGLASASSLVWGACAHELRRAYGQDFGRNPDAWAEWFKEHRDRLAWDAEEQVWRVGG